MRIFYDQHTGRLRAEILLILLDMTAGAAVTLFATGAVREGSNPGDIALLVVWACMPRALAQIIGPPGQPGPGWRSALASALLLALSVLLLFAGWEVISSAAPTAFPIEAPTAALIFLAWGSGLLLGHPRAYRLHDFLIWSVALMALKDARPHPLPWLTAFVTAALLSTSVRHLLHDSFRGVRRARLNLQNARVSALLAVAAAAVVFLGSYAILHGGLDFPAPRPSSASAQIGRKLSSEFIEGDDRRPRGNPPAAQRALREASSAVEKGTDRLVGFTYRVALRDLSLARFDHREVLRLKARGGDGESWRPHPASHWKALSFSHFNPADDSWSEDTEYERVKWPADRRLPRSLPRGLPQAPTISLEARVVTPVCRNVIQPYFTSSIESSQFHFFRESSQGDVFPYPTLARGAKYSLDVVPGAIGHIPVGETSGSHPDPQFIEVPPAGDIGINLGAYARTILGDDAASIQAKVARLRRHFSAELKYSQNVVWKAGRSPLGTFLKREKTGNCTYFATAAALLLRAGGVSSRIAVGFLGAEWDEKTGEAVLKNRTAHAWTEVFFPGDGWYPVDPTGWVPIDTAVPPPEDELAALRDALESDSSRGTDGLGDAATRSPRLPPTSDDRDASWTGDHPVDDGEREVTDELPEGESSDQLDGESWIEYEGEIEGGKAKNETDSADLQPDEAMLPDGFELPAGTDDDARGGFPDSAQVDADGPDPAGTDQESDSNRLRAALRYALAGAGAAVLAMLVAAFLRKKPADDKEKAEQEAEELAGVIAQPTDDDVLASLDESEPRGRVLAEYIRLQRALERTRAHRLPHQTPLEHSRTIRRQRSDVDEAFFDLHRVLYRILYGDEQIGWDEAQTALRSSRKLRRLLG